MSESSKEDRVRFLSGLIVKSLDGYERGDLGLGRLVGEVEGTIDALLDVSEGDWVERVRSAWSGLEVVHAVALNDDRGTLTDDDRRDVGESIAELRALLQSPALT